MNLFFLVSTTLMFFAIALLVERIAIPLRLTWLIVER